MKIFLSWSGENSQSHQVAIALHKWLPRVIQQLDPFLSSHDIDSGINWGVEVDKQLAEIHFGILAITKTSMLAPWLLFEAGALSKQVNRSYVCPYLFGIKPTDLEGPLSKLQSRESNEIGTMMLLETINKALSDDRRLSDEALKDQFEVWWPKLEKDLTEIENNDLTRCDTELENVREDRDLLEEILTLTRKLSRAPAENNDENIAIKILMEELQERKQKMKSYLVKISHLEEEAEKLKDAGESTMEVLQRIRKMLEKYKNASKEVSALNEKIMPLRYRSTNFLPSYS